MKKRGFGQNDLTSSTLYLTPAMPAGNYLFMLFVTCYASGVKATIFV